MLATLRIRNLALVQDLALEFAPGYNAITGETGAGKSVIIGALNLVLGERADRSVIRSGADSCSVEAVFQADGLAPSLHQLIEAKGLEPCEEGQLVLKRVFSSAGANKQFVNGSPTTLSVLSELGNWLMDMHGPHEHQSLLHPSEQLRILDAYAGLLPSLDRFGALARERQAVLERKSSVVVDEQTRAHQIDLLRFQSHEIDSARLLPKEEDQLEIEHGRASNAARLIELAQTTITSLADDDASIINQMGEAGRHLHELAKLDPGAGELAELHEQAGGLLRQLHRDLAAYAERIEIDPERLRQLEERLNLVQGLKRKYGSTIPAILEFGETARKKLLELESRDEELARLAAELARIEDELWKLGRELSAGRKKVIPKLAKAVIKELRDLGFKQSHFDIELSSASRQEAFTRPGWSRGFDSIEFLFAPNPGEPPRSLRAIASSGELARVMLALKTVLAAEDQVPVLVFDEVDANVGGETAGAVGEKMRQIGSRRQVLCITHLAPVAASANAHYVVSKVVRDGRTFSEIERIQGKERVLELARMLGGQGEAARKHAEALLAGG